MKRAWIVLGALILLGATSSARAQDLDDDPADEPVYEDPVAEPAPPPPPPPPPPRPSPAPAAPEAETESSSGRPDGFTVGLGFGWVFPTSLESPNAVSARFRLPSGMTLEPRVELGFENQSMEVGGVDTESSAATIAFAAELRFPMLSRGPVDFVGVGGAGVAFASQDPDGPDNDISTVVVGLSWGLAVEYWISAHWNLSLTATNPLLLYQSTSQDQGAGPDAESKSTTIGAIFDPTIALMLHLFY